MSINQRNSMHISGNGKRTMVLAHGFGCDQTMWRYLAPLSL
jgi:sigma-B regulation protein RsbQ